MIVCGGLHDYVSIDAILERHGYVCGCIGAILYGTLNLSLIPIMAPFPSYGHTSPSPSPSPSHHITSHHITLSIVIFTVTSHHIIYSHIIYTHITSSHHISTTSHHLQSYRIPSHPSHHACPSHDHRITIASPSYVLIA